MITKKSKVEFVSKGSKALKEYKSVAVIPLAGLPDRLLQNARKVLRDNAVVLIGRKTLLTRILESKEETKQLVGYIKDTSAIVLTNDDPFEFSEKLAKLAIRLKAKPNQIAPSDIVIQSQETTLQPGQAVTELKQAGIDVKIQKGKVVIASDKVIKAGDVIETGMAKALHSLNVTPFTASIGPSVVYSGSLLFTGDVLSYNSERMIHDASLAFNSALQLSFTLGIVNQYTVKSLIAKAYSSAVCLGIECKLYDKGIIERLLESAVLQGRSVEANVPAESEASSDIEKGEKA